MKKPIILIINLIIIFNLLLIKAYAQTAEKVVAIAKYKLTHQYDTLNKSLVNKEDFNLFLGKKSSVYKSYDKIVQDSIMKAEANRTGAMAPPPGKRASSDEVFIYQKERKMFTNTATIAGKYVVERSYPTINWKLFSEKKIINGYHCQKANGDYHGRNFTVWFTNDLPFNAGPWKLTGLPGLIVKAEDSTKRIKFDLISFKKTVNNLKKTQWDKETSILLWSDYVKIAKSIEDDPIGYIEKKYGAHITVSSGKEPNHYNPMLPKKSINFPLEAIEYYTLQ